MQHTSSRPCAYCKAPMPVGMAQCRNPKCRQWNIGIEGPATAADMDGATVLLSDAEFGEVERIETKLVDTVFGGGIVRTSVNLLGGEPGAGKTTLCLMLCDLFVDRHPSKEAVYIANEQDPAELRLTARRLRLHHANRIRIVKAMGGVNFDIGDLLLRYQPCFIVLDSVTNWAGQDPRLAVTICKNLKAYTVRLNAPSVVINQVTKGGDHAGLNELQHAVDWLGMFDIIVDPGERVTPDSPRRLMTTKNRFGPAPVEAWYRLHEWGLETIADPYSEGDEPDESDEPESTDQPDENAPD